MAFPIKPKRRSGASGNPTTLELGELAVNTLDGELYLGGDGGVMLLNGPVVAGTIVTQHVANGSTNAFTFSGYTSDSDASVMVSVGGIDQAPSNYSVDSGSGGRILFNGFPKAGEIVCIRAFTAGGAGSGNATELQGTDISAMPPTNGQVLGYDGVNWTPTSTVNATQLQSYPVSTNPPTTDYFLKFNGTNWIAAEQSTSATSLQGTPVSTTSPTEGQGLVYDGTNWAPSTPTADATEIQGQAVSATVPTTGQTFVFGATEWAPGDIDAVKLQTYAISTTAPTTSKALVYDGTAWSPADVDAVKLQTQAVSTTVPTANQALVYDGTSWAPADVNAVKLQGQTVSATAPNTNNVLRFDGTNWGPAVQLPEWSGSITYNTGDYVTRNGVPFIALGQNVATDPAVSGTESAWAAVTGAAAAFSGPLTPSSAACWLRVAVPGRTGPSFIAVYE